MVSDGAKDSLIVRRVLTSTLTNYGAKITSLGIGFFLTPFVLRELGPVDFGLWALTASIAAYVALLDLGMAGALTKYIAEYAAHDRLAEANGLISTAVVLYCLLGAVVLVVGLLAAPIVPLLVQMPASMHDTTEVVILLLTINLALSLPAATTAGIFSGLQQFNTSNALAVMGALVYASMVVAVLLAGGGLVALMAVGIAQTALMLAANAYAVHRIAPQFRPNLRHASLARVRTLFAYSSSLVVIQMGGRLKSQSDEFVIAAFLPVRAITPYALALKLADLPELLANPFLKVLLPLASDLDARGDDRRLRTLYVTATRLTLVVTLPVAIVLVVLSSDVLRVWAGQSYGRYGYLVVILTLATAVDTCTWPVGAILQGIGRHRQLAWVSATFALLNLGLSLALVPRFGLGGIAMGTLIPACAECTLFVYRYGMRTLRVPLGEVLREVLLPGLIPCIPQVAGMYTLLRLWSPATLVGVAVQAAAGVGVYAMGYIVFSSRESERRAVRRVAVSGVAWVRMRSGFQA